MAVRKTRYSKPSKLGIGKKYAIRFDYSAKRFFLFKGKKKVGDKDFKSANEALEAIENNLV